MWVLIVVTVLGAVAATPVRIKKSSADTVIVPPNCPDWQQLDESGQCRVVWNDDDDKKHDKSRLGELEEAVALNDQEFSRSLTRVPNQCPNGYRADALGFCRRILPP